jgi:hypothetical protein
VDEVEAVAVGEDEGDGVALVEVVTPVVGLRFDVHAGDVAVGAERGA